MINHSETNRVLRAGSPTNDPDSIAVMALLYRYLIMYCTVRAVAMSNWYHSNRLLLKLANNNA